MQFGPLLAEPMATSVRQFGIERELHRVIDHVVDLLGRQPFPEPPLAQRRERARELL